MAVRSFNITFQNSSGWPLQLTTQYLDHGEWSDNLIAPNTVAAGATITFQSESDGVMTGTQGHVVYQVMDNSDGAFDITTWVYITWNNPYAGTTSMNALTSTVPVDAAGNPAVSNSSGFSPPKSPYEQAHYLQGGDGTSPDWNPGAIVPIFDIGSIFADVGNIAHAQGLVQVTVKLTDYVAWGKRHRASLGNGLRALNPPNGSMRALMQLPPATPPAR
jgi:hypothetical protein